MSEHCIFMHPIYFQLDQLLIAITLSVEICLCQFSIMMMTLKSVHPHRQVTKILSCR